jgi:hypothetical protein
MRSLFNNRSVVLVSVLSIFYFLLILFLLLNSCKKRENAPTCNYNKDIKPIIAAHCMHPGCHGGGSTIADYTDYEVLKTQVDAGRVRSYIFDLKIMPPATIDSLSGQDKQKIKCWLDAGGLQN